MSIQSDFAAYTNALGFVSNKPAGSSGNDLLFSCQAAILRKALNAWSQTDEDALRGAIVAQATLSPGLFARPGWKQDQEQPDDYYGLAALSTVYAIMILAYAKHHFWYFKTSPAAKWYEPMFWRFPALMSHVHWCAVETPNPLLRLSWCLSVAFSGSKTSQDPWMLNALLVGAAGNQGWLEKLASKIYRHRLKKTWGSLKAVRAAYFGDPNHPLVTYCQEP